MRADPDASFSVTEPVTEIFVGVGDVPGSFAVVENESGVEAETKGQSGIANVTSCLTTGIVSVQFAPQAGHVALNGTMESTFASMSIVAPSPTSAPAAKLPEMSSESPQDHLRGPDSRCSGAPGPRRSRRSGLEIFAEMSRSPPVGTPRRKKTAPRRHRADWFPPGRVRAVVRAPVVLVRAALGEFQLAGPARRDVGDRAGERHLRAGPVRPRAGKRTIGRVGRDARRPRDAR